jgi:hypothetical protein
MGGEDMRKVVQITNINDTLAAVCDDGSVWFLAIQWDESFADRRWTRVRDIPQQGEPHGGWDGSDE